jgi:hypothetical protein
MVMPKVEEISRVAFRHVRGEERREDLREEMVGVAWMLFVQLAEQGKDGTQFPLSLAIFAAKRVKAGRGVCGQEKSKDVLSPLAKRQRGFTVSSLPNGSGDIGNIFDAALTDNTQSPVPEQVSFRIDFPAWMKTKTDRNRRIMVAMMEGEETSNLATKYKLSPARISQLRQEFHDDWQRFTGVKES